MVPPTRGGGRGTGTSGVAEPPLPAPDNGNGVAGGFVVILMIITDPKAEDVNLVELPVRFLL